MPPRNVFFTGRKEYLNSLRIALTEHSSVALSGIGGMGKTQTAIEYAYVYRAEYRAAFWCVADSRDALLSGFAALANLLNLPEKDEQDLNVVAAAVRRWLESNSGWLLILDNVDDLALAHDFVPSGGHLLVTPRPHATGAFADGIELKKMEPEERAEFLMRRAKKSDRAVSQRGLGADAELLYRRALAIYEKALGPEHPHTINAADNYAILLKKLDRPC